MNANAHSVYRLNYHLILVVKYRRKVFTHAVSERAKAIFEDISAHNGVTLLEWNHDVDHVHVLFEARPDSLLGKFVGAYKSASSRMLKREFPLITKQLWEKYFWSHSYCLITAGGAPLSILKQYIENQGLP